MAGHFDVIRKSRRSNASTLSWIASSMCALHTSNISFFMGALQLYCLTWVAALKQVMARCQARIIVTVASGLY